MKKNLQILMMMVLWGTFFLMRGYGQNQNLNAHLTINSFAIYDANDQAIPLDEGDDPANYSFGLASGEFAEIKFTYTINTGDYLIQAGDIVTISMVYAINNDFIYTDFSETPIYDNENNKIGTIRKNLGVYTITFSDNAVGKNTLNGSFSSGHSVKRHLSSSQDEVRIFKFNGVDYKYLAEKIDRKPISTERFYKACESSSSSSIMWNLGFFRRIERYLSDPVYATNRQDTNWVNQNMRFSDVYVEDTISDAGASRVSPPAFTALIFPPMSDDDPTTSTQATGTSVSITSFFTRLYPIAGESLDDFRDRVKNAPLQYGTYKVSDGLFVFMAFMGNWPNSGITYQNSGCETNVNNTTNSNWSDTQKQLWREVHAADNCLGGAVGVFTIQFNVEYSSPVVIETQKRNVARVYMSELTWPSASVGTMKPTAQEAIPQTGTVKVVKFDEDSRQPLAGIKFTLERWDGTAWVSHSIQGVSSWTTGNNGIIEISDIVDGRYRFVEDNTTAFDSGYDATKLKFYANADLTTEITDFTVNTTSTEGVLLYASNKKLVQYGEKYFYKNIADLPADVRTTLPTRDNVYYNGNVVIPESPSETTVTVGYYQYDFEGWDSTQITINNADAVFTGSWKKTALPVNLTVQKMLSGDPNGYDKDWTFELTVPQTVVSQVSSTPALTFDANGKASFTMKHGDSRTIAIPCGTVISIMETGTKGYEVSHDVVGKLNSNYSETVTDSTFNLTNIILEEPVIITFKNNKLYTVTYKPGTQGMFADDVHSGLNYNVSTPSFAGLKDGSGRPLGNPGYEFVGWDKEVKSFVTEDAEYVAQWGVASDSDACRVPISSITLGTHTDTTCTPMTVDGEVYPVVLINGHCWTKENLRTATPNSMVYSTDMNPADETTYGRLYTYSEATSLCPEGWHLPTSVETASLTTYDAWGLMSVDNWIVDGTDKSGFSAQPAGFYSYATQRFEGMRSTTGFLTDTEGNVFVINYYCCSANMEHTNSGNAYSVRCVKDASTAPNVVIDEKSCPEAQTVTDIESNVYATVKIGNQCWMRDNLRTTTSPSTKTYLVTTNYGSYTGKQACWYGNDSARYAPQNYGLLYNWNAAVDTFKAPQFGETSVNSDENNAVSVTFTGHRRGICPEGWHVPSREEWNTLTNNVGNNLGTYNAMGFSVVPVGYCSGSGFRVADDEAFFWSSSQLSTRFSAWFKYLSSSPSLFMNSMYNKSNGFSVRCVKDNDAVIDEKSCPEAKTVTDVDNNAYATVKIGNQCWMRQNMRATKYADGTAIDEGWTTASSSTPYYYNYTSSGIDLKDRGLLYNWSAATRNTPYNNVNVRGICPTGWHLPSDAEWDTLTTYVGSQSNYTCDNNTNNIAKALADTTGWNSSNNNCEVGKDRSDNNKTGFSAVPAGDCSGSSFNGAGAYANFWSSTQINSSHACYRALYYYLRSVDGNFTSKFYGYSVRCVKD
ncbi:MAG: FISUMP domain-containing protein [Bacteroidales bacterium]|nr:FISUMP domain-containing protein [Bacteroidales bacterium]